MCTLSAFRALGRSSDDCGMEAPYSVNSSTVTVESSGIGATILPDGEVRLDGYSFPEAPPSYNEAARTSPRPPSVSPQAVNNSIGGAEPPPPYPDYTSLHRASK